MSALREGTPSVWGQEGVPAASLYPSWGLVISGWAGGALVPLVLVLQGR